MLIIVLYRALSIFVTGKLQGLRAVCLTASPFAFRSNFFPDSSGEPPFPLGTCTGLPNGTGLVFSGGGQGGYRDLMLLSLGGDRRQEPLLQTPYDEVNAELSPNGRWLAYQSNESDHYEIYVRPFPNVTAGKWQVSTSGGTRPVWARNGQELFYESMGALMRVPVTTDSTFTNGTATKLFDAAPYFFGPAPGGRAYDVSPDGKRFLMIKQGGEADEPAPSARLVLVQHWFEELKRLVPTK